MWEALARARYHSRHAFAFGSRIATSAWECEWWKSWDEDLVDEDEDKDVLRDPSGRASTLYPAPRLHNIYCDSTLFFEALSLGDAEHYG